MYILELWSLVEVDSDVGSEGRQHTSLLGQMEEKMQRVKENLKDPAAKLLGSGKKKKTVFQALLDDVVNGNRILSKCLDDLISSPSNTKPDSEDFTLNIDFSGLIKTNSTKQCENLFDIVNKSKSGKICEIQTPALDAPDLEPSPGECIQRGEEHVHWTRWSTEELGHEDRLVQKHEMDAGQGRPAEKYH